MSPVDIELLSALEDTGSVVEACTRIGITRDRGMYRLRRLERALATPAVVSLRGGSTRGSSSLTDAGRRVLLQGPGPLRSPASGETGRALGVNLLRGTWRSTPQPRVSLGPGTDLFVTFTAHEGETVRVAVEPEAIVVARSRFRSSARNVLAGTVESVVRTDAQRSRLRVRVGDVRLDAAITPRSVASLRLRAGVRVVLVFKATAVARLG